MSLKSYSCPEGAGVYAAGISVEVSAHYPGRSGELPCATGPERGRDGAPEVSRGHSKAEIGPPEGLNMKCDGEPTRCR